MIYTITYGQTLYDLSILLYGDASHVLKIITDNPTIDNIQNIYLTGLTVSYTNPGLSLTNYWTSNDIVINTGQSQGNISVKAFSSAFPHAFR